jgi:hypothetical protein
MMKIIDLLNKIANGEEVPKKIKVLDTIYYLCENDASNQCYFSEKEGCGGIGLKFDTSNLNDEIEIIEEDKEIEKLKIVENGSINSYALLDKNGTKCALTKHSKIIADKINEIIDVINKGDK